MSKADLDKWEKEFRDSYEGANCEMGSISSRMCDTFIKFISKVIKKHDEAILQRIEGLKLIKGAPNEYYEGLEAAKEAVNEK